MDHRAIITRLGGLTDVVQQIRELCGVPSISVGVLHEGRVIHTKSVGYRDVERKLPADEDSLYLLASISKSFVTAALGILVDEGKPRWKDLVSKHLPDFNPSGDPRISQEADLIDLLRHSAGLSNPVVSQIEPQGAVQLHEEDFLELVNSAPTRDEDEQYFNREWVYSNYWLWPRCKSR
ncbi:hypothetical protein CAC42_917 [Sphaceloma murrayae]|uniref:Beta-lactamase-related domain-containing protein n=1 Tax=Sphaceloma murrayae TaxID=2082308 RepID=A0A2K1R2P2_9PEZI|nr:hypothetical protein CAC42_917 [Sphaceloma murrayae]